MRPRYGHIRPSGYVFVLILALLLLSAWNTGENLLYVLLGGVASFVILSLFSVWWTLQKIALLREPPHAVHRTEPFLVPVRIENRRWFFPAIALRVEDAAERGKQIGFVMKIPARCAATLNVVCELKRRGVYRLPPFEIVTSFPFGLFERRKRFSDKQEIIVYPRVRAVRTSAVEQSPGNTTFARRASADGDEYFGLREYQPGDELRRIAWRVSARRGIWMVREHAWENSRLVFIILDTRIINNVPDFRNHFEDIVELAASLAVTFLHRQYQVSVVTPTETLESGEGTHQEHRVLEMLARVEPTLSTAVPRFDAEASHIEAQRVKLIYLTPDPRRWGRRIAAGPLQALDPREVVHA